jgi:uncharacterized protein YigE (DUF2233 family)
MRIKNDFPWLAGRMPAAILVACVFPGAVRAAARDGPEPQTIAPGLEYARHERDGTVAHVLEMELKTKTLKLRSIKAKGKETVRQLVDRVNGEETMVVGAINGDFFRQETSAGLPYGVQVSDGRLIFAPMNRSMIGFKLTNEPFMGIATLRARLSMAVKAKAGPPSKWPAIDGVNVLENDVEFRRGIFLYTPAFLGLNVSRPNGLIAVVEEIEPALQVGDVCEGKVARIETADKPVDVPESGCLLCFFGDEAKKVARGAKVGGPVSIQIDLPPIPAGVVSQAIGGGPRLVRDGRISVEIEKESFPSMQRLEIGRTHPRSAIGYDRAKAKLFFVMVEGRVEGSRGMNFLELAKFMKDLGCFQAMGFDGGGSAALYVAGKGIVSRGTEERQIANALLITIQTKPIPGRKVSAKRAGEEPGPKASSGGAAGGNAGKGSDAKVPAKPEEKPSAKDAGKDGAKGKEIDGPAGKKETPKEGEKGEVKPWDP